MKHSSLISVCMILATIALVCLGVYFGVADAVKRFAFSGDQFSEEPWRIASFPFVHITLSHLVQNMLALLVIVLLALEITVLGYHILATFFGASLLIAFADIVAFPWMVIAGASVGIYALYGVFAIRGSSFLSPMVMVSLFGIPLVIQVVSSYFAGGAGTSLASAVLHLAGFGLGAGAFFLLDKCKKTRIRVLQEVTA